MSYLGLLTNHNLVDRVRRWELREDVVVTVFRFSF